MPIGRDLVGASLPAGLMRGIVIDNPSGSWLYLPVNIDWVPPYTIGWSRSLDGLASIDILFSDGPAGQVSTQQGDPPRVWLDSEPVAPSSGIASPGAAFIEGFTPVLAAFTQQTLTSLGPPGNVVLIAPVANRRIRLYSVSVQLGRPDDSQGFQQQVPIAIGVFDDTIAPATLAILNLSPEHPSDQIGFQPGLDVVTGAGVLAGGAPFWSADAYYNINATYSRI
jgi:hypothetical protein